MKSLERQLQVNLAVTLVVVMLLIWAVGLALPYLLADSQSLHSPAYVCPPADLAVEAVLQHRPQRFKWLFPFLAAGGVIAVLLVQGMVIRRSFRRLDHIRAELQALEAGKISKLDETVPAEIQPVVSGFNQLLGLMQERLERSRNALGNLAHALKGPLHLLMQSLEDTDSNPQQAKLQAERIQQLTERELKRARMAGAGNGSRRFDPRTELPVLVEVLERIHHKSPRCITFEIAPDVDRFGEREDILELIGNLLDNACKWATTRVYCGITRDNGRTCICVEDDGDGRSEAELQCMAQRGVRLDESVEGHGLGLSICKDIARLYAGSLTFTRSGRLGGLKVVVVL